MWLNVKCCSRCSLINCNTRRSLAERAQTHAERWYLPPCPPFTPFIRNCQFSHWYFFKVGTLVYPTDSPETPKGEEQHLAYIRISLCIRPSPIIALSCQSVAKSVPSLLFFSWLSDLAMGTTIMWLALIDVFKYDDVYSINLRVCTVFQSTFIEFQGKTVRWCL